MVARSSDALMPALVAASVFLLLAAMITPRAFRSLPPWAQATSRLVIFAGLTFVLVWQVGSPFRPRFDAERAGLGLLEQLVEALWWVLAARSAIGLSRLLVVLEHRPRESQIISDLIAGAVCVATLFAVVNFVFGVPIGGLVATSGVIAIVLGLALQSTLADVFSGIAVGVERPYRTGDLLWVEGGIEGKVVQVNWRSTHVATMNGDVAIVPNSVIAKARLVNHSLPSPRRSSSVEIRLDASVPPDHCMATLRAAIRSCLVPFETPTPSIARTALHGDGAVYEIGFSVASGDRLGEARNELFAEIQRHLRHAGIPLAVVGLASVPSLSIPTGADLLRQSDLFAAFATEDRQALAENLEEIWLEAGEILFLKGDCPKALFIVASGAVELLAERTSGEKVRHRMGPGGTLGAVGLITGQPYAATATTLTPLKAYRLDRGAVAAAIASSPQLASGLEALARRGQAAIRNDLAAHNDERKNEPADVFRTRMRNFLTKLAVGDHASS